MADDEDTFEANMPKKKEKEEAKITLSLTRAEAIGIYIALAKEVESYYKMIETINSGEANTKTLNQLGKYLEKK